jgi:transposase
MLAGEETVTELCRWDGISKSYYYRLIREFSNAGKLWLGSNTKRQVTSDEMVGSSRENEQLMRLVAELTLKNRLLKRCIIWLWLKNG